MILPLPLFYFTRILIFRRGGYIIVGKGLKSYGKSKIDRIGELYRKSKSAGLTPAELAEQQALRREYLDAVRKNFRQTLDSIEYED